MFFHYSNLFNQYDSSSNERLSNKKDWIAKAQAEDPIRTYILIAYDRVYDVSNYMVPVGTPDFLGPNVLKIIQAAGKDTKDSTPLWEQLRKLEGNAQFNRYPTKV
jgi:hypothetical protein